MKIKEVLRNMGEKSATNSIDPRSWPRIVFQPTPPAKIKAQISKGKE